MKLKRTFYAVVGFITVAVGKRMIVRKSRKALHR